jgi:quercetin dioxygenase-like cupin family protein
MRFAVSFFGLCIILLGHVAKAPLTPSPQSTEETKLTPVILLENEGERREFRTRPGTFFTLKLDPKNRGSKHMTVMGEDMAPGGRIPTHRHPHCDELIIIRAGAARVTLGDKAEEAHAGAIVFIPQDTWIGVENLGNEHLIITGIMSEPGYEEYLRAISAPAGEPIVPLSSAELNKIRAKHSDTVIYK